MTNTKYHVITDIPGSPDGFWGKNTIYCKPWQATGLLCKIFGKNTARRAAGAATAIKLLSKRSKTDAYITSGTLIGISFALLQTLFFWNRKPHVLIDCIWYQSRNRLRNRTFSLALIMASPSVTKFVVWASHELEDYPKAFGIDPSKFEFVHFWHTLSGYNFKIRDEGYVFAGGNWDRDYKTVIETARKLPEIPFRIGTTRPEQLDGLDIPPNIAVKGYSHEGFRRAMASSRIVLVPMERGLLHSGGQQTVLNAMYMGKPTIAIGHRWASDLIENNINGYIIDYKDTDSLVEVILTLWDNARIRKKVSQKAIETGKSWPPERSLDIICHIALEPLLIREQNK
jgi:glycosyltransferase involved in cell wall biosynthesis